MWIHWDLLARGGALAALVITAVALARERRYAALTWSGVGLAVAISAHLVVSIPAAGTSGVWPPFLMLASTVPAWFWLFTRALFEERRRWQGRELSVLAIGMLGGIPAAAVTRTVQAVAGLTLVSHALYLVVRDRGSDLLETRWRFRLVFSTVTALTVAVILGMEWVLRGTEAAPWQHALKSTGTCVLAGVFGAWLLRVRGDLGLARTVVPPDPEAADARLAERLEVQMRDERLYLVEGLTLGGLARRLDVPEYRLRRVINQRWGHRNFADYLNRLRIDEAVRRLSDPSAADLPISTLALDLGYGSLGPFNRAFRARTGVTPSEFRRAHAQSLAEL